MVQNCGIEPLPPKGLGFTDRLRKPSGLVLRNWCHRSDSNRGPFPYQGNALPLCYGGERAGDPLASVAKFRTQRGQPQTACTDRAYRDQGAHNGGVAGA